MFQCGFTKLTDEEAEKERITIGHKQKDSVWYTITDLEGNIIGETDILLEKADEVRKKIAQAYIDEKEDIRPLVLVQFPNLNGDLIEHVEEKLNLMGYSYENKLLASWFSAENKEEKNRKSKKLGKINIGTTDADSITKSNATLVFLLFKQALATGWDCP